MMAAGHYTSPSSEGEVGKRSAPGGSAVGRNIVKNDG